MDCIQSALAQEHAGESQLPVTSRRDGPGILAEV